MRARVLAQRASTSSGTTARSCRRTPSARGSPATRRWARRRRGPSCRDRCRGSGPRPRAPRSPRAPRRGPASRACPGSAGDTRRGATAAPASAAEAGELLDGERAAAVERPLDLEAVVARRPETREVGGDDAGAAADQPLGPVHPEPRPVPEVVRALEVEVVAGPEDGGVARLEAGAGAAPAPRRRWPGRARRRAGRGGAPGGSRGRAGAARRRRPSGRSAAARRDAFRRGPWSGRRAPPATACTGRGAGRPRGRAAPRTSARDRRPACPRGSARSGRPRAGQASSRHLAAGAIGGGKAPGPGAATRLGGTGTGRRERWSSSRVGRPDETTRARTRQGLPVGAVLDAVPTR